MDSTDNASLLALTDEQIERLAAVVLDEFGPNLTRTQFNDVVLTLFEDIAGFETVPRDRMARYLKVLWTTYQRSITSSRVRQSPAQSPRSLQVLGILPQRVDSRSARHSYHITEKIEFSASIEGLAWKTTGRITTSETATPRNRRNRRIHSRATRHTMSHTSPDRQKRSSFLDPIGSSALALLHAFRVEAHDRPPLRASEYSLSPVCPRVRHALPERPAGPVCPGFEVRQPIGHWRGHISWHLAQRDFPNALECVGTPGPTYAVSYLRSFPDYYPPESFPVEKR